MTTEKTVSPWPHRAAVLVAVLTLPLIFMGGRVTSTGSGMAVPDWPTTFGENMFTFPLSKWVGPVGIEHSHRIMGSIVGVATILLALAFGFLEPRRWVRPLGVVALVLVSIQGILGGKRVVLYEQGLAPIHGCFAQLFFAFVSVLVAITGKSFREAAPIATPRAATIRKLALATAGTAYLQVVLGAWYRHTALARLEPHATTAFVLLALAVVLTIAIKRAARGSWIAATGRKLHALLGTQILLGIASWWVKPLDLSPDAKVFLVSTHLVVGALVVGTCAALAVQTRRGLVAGEAASPAASPQPEMEVVT